MSATKDLTAKDRQAVARERKRKAGLMPVAVWLPAAEAAALRKRVKAVLAGSDSFVVDPARAKLDPAEADELSAALNDEAQKLLASVAELLSSADGETIGRLARQVQITRDRGSSRTMD